MDTVKQGSALMDIAIEDIRNPVTCLVEEELWSSLDQRQNNMPNDPLEDFLIYEGTL